MTIKDVARYCGVSVSTVSRVLNNHPDVSDEVRKRVTKAVQDLHYVPNRSAQDLVRQQQDVIGVVVRGADNTFYTPIIRSIGRACDEASYTMVLSQIDVDANEIEEGASLASSKRLRGLILLGGRFDYTREEAASLGVPFVCCAFTNHFGNLDKDSYSSVSINDKAVAYHATKELIDNGHKRIAVLLDSAANHSVSELRYRGYVQALDDAGIERDNALVARADGFTMAAAYNATRRLLHDQPDVTAIFAVSDSMAIAALKAIADAGLSVPDDISVIAIDGIEMSLYTVPTLTTLSQPQETLGEEAVRILVDVLGGEASSRHVRLETTLRPGGTVGKVR